MNNKREPLFDPDFDLTTPEEGVVVPEDAGMDEPFARHLPSETDIAIAARGAFGKILPDEVIHDLICSSSEINEAVRRIMHEHLKLGFQFGEIMRRVQRAYTAKSRDSQRTTQRATNDAFAYIAKLHRISNSKVRLHLRAYVQFHSNTEAIEFLSQTDMQWLFAKDPGDDIVNAVIEKRKANPEMSTREVRDLIAAYRQVRGELAAIQEQVESANDETARLHTLYDVSKAEERRLHREMEQMRLRQLETQEATGRLCNELALVAGTRNALHQHITDTERERDAARWEVAEMRKRLAKRDDAEARATQRRYDDHISGQVATSRQLDEKIEAQKAEEASTSARLREAEAAREARSRVDEQMSALLKDFWELAQRYRSAQLLCNAAGSPERYKPVLNVLEEIVGKFYREIVTARKTALRYVPRKREDVQGRNIPHEPGGQKEEQ